MDFQIVHTLPGRVRLRYRRHLLDARQASLVQMLVSLQEGISNVAVNTISGSILIEYDESVLSQKKALSYVSVLGDKYLKNEDLLKSVTVPAAQESLVANLLFMVAQFYLKKLLLPLSVRRVLSP